MWCLLAWALLFFLPITGLSLLMQTRSPRAVRSRNSPCWLGHQFPVASPSTSCDQPPSHCTCSGSAPPSPPAAATSMTLSLDYPLPWPPSSQGELATPAPEPLRAARHLLLWGQFRGPGSFSAAFSATLTRSPVIGPEPVSLGILAWPSFHLECLFLSSVCL